MIKTEQEYVEAKKRLVKELEAIEQHHFKMKKAGLFKEQIQLANQDSKDWLKSGDHWVGGNKNMAKSFPKFQKFSQKQGTGVGPPMMLAR